MVSVCLKTAGTIEEENLICVMHDHLSSLLYVCKSRYVSVRKKIENRYVMYLEFSREISVMLYRSRMLSRENFQ